jgi:hypothetical protein
MASTQGRAPATSLPKGAPAAPANLRILQLDIMKSRAGMEALINDKQTQDLDILLIQEPPLSATLTTSTGSYQPTHSTEGVRKRSLVYVNKRI